MSILRRKQCVEGFALVELIIFIVVTAVLATGLFAAFSVSTVAMAPAADRVRAATLAAARMELILGRRRTAGSYAAFLADPDPCSGATAPAICTAPPGFVFPAPVIAVSALGAGLHEVIVQVQGAADAEVRMLVAEY